MPHTYTNDSVTFYEDTGDGPVVVLVHGHSLDLRMWKYQVGPLVDMGYRVIRYDVRGHGRSMVTPSGYTWDNYSQDLTELLDRLNVEKPAEEPLAVDSVHVVGLSMGGGIALKFALDHPERVLSLTLVDSTLPGFGYSEEFAASIRALREAVAVEGKEAAFARLWLNNAMFDGVRRYPERFAEVVEMVAGFQAAEYLVGSETPGYVQPDLAARLGEVTAPTLVVAGQDDIPDFVIIATLMEANIPGARRVELAGCGQLPPMEDPVAFNRTLLEFLAGL